MYAPPPNDPRSWPPQQQQPYPYAPPPPPKTGMATGVVIGIVVGILGVFALVAVFVIGVAFGARSGAAARPPEQIAENLPPVRRDVPVHPAALLTNCSKADLALIEERIGGAIEQGAPTYNAGDFLGCYTTYERAAVATQSALSASCRGPTIALEAGRSKAKTATTPADKAWAMRDAFDGVLEVIDRVER